MSAPLVHIRVPPPALAVTVAHTSWRTACGEPDQHQVAVEWTAWRAGRDTARHEASTLCPRCVLHLTEQSRLEPGRRRLRVSATLLRFQDFRALVDAVRGDLDQPDRAWLEAWERWDLACSPMDDAARRHVRHGHRLGWGAAWDRRQAT